MELARVSLFLLAAHTHTEGSNLRTVLFIFDGGRERERLRKGKCFAQTDFTASDEEEGNL